MATAAASQVAFSATAGSDRAVRSSGIQGTNNLSFANKSWTGAALSCDGKAAAQQRRHVRKVLCSAVQQSRKSKVSVVPLDLESAKEPPLNTYKPKGPYTATIVSVERAVGPNAPGETCHVVIDHGGNVPYWEGQSYGIIPPGENPKKPGNPQNVRLYSIASTRYGDSFDGKTASLCVRRAVYYDPETGKEDPSKNGVCSNFLCNSKPGDKIQLTGKGKDGRALEHHHAELQALRCRTSPTDACHAALQERPCHHVANHLDAAWKSAAPACCLGVLRAVYVPVIEFSLQSVPILCGHAQQL